MEKINLRTGIPARLPEELSEKLVEAKGVRVERIVSQGHSSPPDFWFDQGQSEWVLLIEGAARLRFEDETLEMRPGDCVNIPAHRKHRVEWTTPDGPTIWLAVFYNE